MSERAAFADAVSRYLACRLRGAAEQIESLALEPLDARVRRVLRLLAANRASTSGPVPLTLTQEDLAALAGASRQRVHGVLMDLRRRGLVEVGYGRVRVIEPSRL
jgi:CRP-like cAMP-binding protein